DAWLDGALLVGDRVPEHERVSTAGRQHRGEHPDEGRFPGPVRTEQPEERATRDGERCAIHRVQLAETAHQGARLDGKRPVTRHAFAAETRPREHGGHWSSTSAGMPGLSTSL